MTENDNPTATMQDLVKIDLLSAIRSQTDAARRDLPGPGSAALRNLAEAYAIVTAPTLPLFPRPETAAATE
ncbi:hypothetical protein [Streptomyces nigra]|uniref:hypothetical protein n=1 Tax=Streptomyces nigra TaxID=1827580 RepID=UPI00362CDEE8